MIKALSLPTTLAMKVFGYLKTADIIPEDTVNPYLNSATSGGQSLGKLLGQYWGEAICEAFSFVLHKVEPFVEYGLKISCLIYFIIYLTTKDTQSSAKALKMFFIYLIYEIVMGAM